MTNPPDPKTKTPSDIAKRVLELSEKAEGPTWASKNEVLLVKAHKSRKWNGAVMCDGELVAMVFAETPHECEAAMNMIAECRTAAPELARAYTTLELENQSLTRRLEEATKERDAMRSNWDVTTGMLQQSRKQLDGATAKLTALRTAAEGARVALNRAFWVAERQIEKLEVDKRDSEFWQGEAGKIAAALAALRAELDQADSNASNSPTASRDSQG